MKDLNVFFKKIEDEYKEYLILGIARQLLKILYQ